MLPKMLKYGTTHSAKKKAVHSLVNINIKIAYRNTMKLLLLIFA